MIRPGSALRLIAAAALIPATTAQAGLRSQELRPSGPWHVDWTKHTCTLSRTFGDVDDPLILSFARFGPADQFQLIMAGKRLRGTTYPVKLTLRYGSSGHVHSVKHYFNGRLPDRTPTVIVVSSALQAGISGKNAAALATPVIEQATRQITIVRGGSEIVLDTGSLGPPFAALRQCTDDLVKTWGLDPAQQNALLHRPTPKTEPGTWLRPVDYPIGALMMGSRRSSTSA